MSDDTRDTFDTKPPSSEELLDELGSLKELLDEELENATVYSSVDEISSVEEYLRLKQAADAAGIGIEEYLEQQATTASDDETLELLEPGEEEIPLLDEVVETVSTEPEPSLVEEAAAEHIPTTAEATTVEEYFAAVAAAKHPQRPTTAPLPDNVVEDAIPTLDEVVVPEEAIPVLDEVVAEEDDIPLLEEAVADAGEVPTLDEVVPVDADIPLLDELVVEESSAIEPGMSMEEMQELVDLLVNRKLERLKPELEKEVMSELQKLLPLSALKP